MDLGIRGHVALISGAGRGIGAATARTLAGEGVRVGVWDRDEGPAMALVDEIRQSGGEAVALVGSVSSPEDTARVVEELAAAFGSIQIVINIAGFSHLGPVQDITDQQWDEVIGVHLNGSLNPVRAVAPMMMEQKYGRIVNMSSLAANGAPNMTTYSMVKAGLQGFTRALASELGPHNITANAVAPGVIPTERIRSLGAYPALQQSSLRGQSVKREGTPEDVANAIAFLVSERSGFINGEVLNVTGGMQQLW